jgi:glycosyltransferase involved in cell wall biosynthesis
MREMLIITPDDYSAGGLQRSAVAVRNALDEAGYCVTIFCFKLFPEGLATKYPFIQVLSRDRRSKLLFWLSTLSALRRHIRTRSPEAVIAFGRVPSILLPFVSAFLKVPLTIGSERAYPPSDPAGPIFSLLRRIAFPHLHVVVCQTEPIRAWFVDELHMSEKKLTIIPNIVRKGSVGRSAKAASKSASKSIVAAGRLDAQKGFTYALQIFSKVLERVPNATLSIAGEGPLRERLEDQADALGIRERVRFLGRVADLAPLWDSADLLLFSSLYEGFPNVLAEAMAHGVPAVSFDCPTGPSDLIESGVNGYLVPVGDVESAVRDCVDLLTNDEKRRMFGARAAEVSERFSAAGVGRLWRQLVEGPGGKPAAP